MTPKMPRHNLRWSQDSRTIALGSRNSVTKRSSTEVSASPKDTDLRVNKSSERHSPSKRIKHGLPEAGVRSGTRVRTKNEI
jgi:hypothetical protein